MQIDLRYITRFSYLTPVWESQNALRACPRDEEGQRLIDYRLEVDPPARVVTFVDRWGSRVDCFGVRQLHEQLTVTVDASVVTSPRPMPDRAVPVAELASATYRETHWMYLEKSRHARWDDELEKVAESAVAHLDETIERIRAIQELVHRSLEYRPGSTTVGVDVNQVWATGAGVCQDFAHVALAMLRATGIAARYVSGYFYAADAWQGDAPSDETIGVQTHAWVEAAVPGFGWWGIDPTNALVAGERHVVIGRGRDYDDVTPLRGVYYGDSDHHLAAKVWMRSGRLERSDLPQLADQ